MFLRVKVWGLFLLLILNLYSCKPKVKSYNPTLTTIDGTITSSESPVISLVGDVEIKSSIDTSGNFIIQSELTKPGIYRLEVSNQSTNVFIVPGDRITVQGDFRNMKTATQYKGDHANENNYLVALEQLKAGLPFGNYESFYGQDEEGFIRAVEERTNTIVADLQDYQKRNESFDEVFLGMINDDISYEAAIMKLNYPNIHKYVNQLDSFVVSDTYESFLQNIDIDNDNNLMIPSYTEFLNVYLDYKVNSESEDVSASVGIKKYHTIDKLFQQPMVKSLLYFETMKELFTVSVNDAYSVLDDYLVRQTNLKYREIIESSANDWSTLRKGTPAPEWFGTDKNGNKISANQFLGKVVYLDFWATWCGPCIQELPYLDKLNDEFAKNDNIKFVSISLDQEIKAWKNYLKQNALPGIQIYADPSLSSALLEQFKIRGIPRFIVIGKDGKMVDPTAPRPSSGLILKRILETATL